MNQKQTKKKTGAGFTLIEILVVIGLIAILATIVIIAINPARQFAQGRDTQRTSHLNTILNAIGQRMADNKGFFGDGTTLGIDGKSCPKIPSHETAAKITLPPKSGTVPAEAVQIGTASGNIDLSCLVPTYMSTMQFDPNGTADAANTGYYIVQDNNTTDGAGRVLLYSTSTEAPLNRTDYIYTER